MLPTKEQAENLLTNAEKSNPGLWVNHSRITAECARKIALSCDDLDEEKAYILGLLHDIGRKFGIRHLGHVVDGYRYMTDLGYDEVARICLSHSFNTHTIDCYVGKFDVTDSELEVIKINLSQMTFDEYDLLIQLCDCLAGANGVLNIEQRMADVKSRYGYYPRDKWNKNIELKKYFELKIQKNIYDVLNL